jgi:hypothetical protein
VENKYKGLRLDQLLDCGFEIFTRKDTYLAKKMTRTEFQAMLGWPETTPDEGFMVLVLGGAELWLSAEEFKHRYERVYK